MHTLYTIHGNGLSSEIFSELTLPGINIKHLTIPGHGGTSLPENSSFPQLVEILRKQIDQTEDFSLLGFSLGGHLVHHLCEVLQPKIVISMAAPPLSPITIPRIFNPLPAISHLFTAQLSEEQKLELADSFLELHPERNKDVIRILNQCDPKFRERMAQDVQLGLFKDELEILSRLKDRCHFVFAKHDTLLNQDFINSLNLKNIYWVEGGHLIPWEDPSGFVKIIRLILST